MLVRRPATLSTLVYAVPLARAEGLEVDAVGGAEDPFERRGVGVGALLQGGEDRAAVVVDDDQGQVGTGLVRADDQAVGVVEEGHVAEQGQGAGRVAAAEGDADGGGDGPVDAGQATVPDDEPVLVRGVRRGHEVEVADGFDEPATRVA